MDVGTHRVGCTRMRCGLYIPCGLCASLYCVSVASESVFGPRSGLWCGHAGSSPLTTHAAIAAGRADDAADGRTHGMWMDPALANITLAAGMDCGGSTTLHASPGRSSGGSSRSAPPNTARPHARCRGGRGPHAPQNPGARIAVWERPSSARASARRMSAPASHRCALGLSGAGTASDGQTPSDRDWLTRVGGVGAGVHSSHEGRAGAQAGA